MLNNKKIKKFFKSPSIFFKDYLNKKHPVIRNEILCREEEEEILVKNDLQLESLIEPSFPIDIVFTWVDNKDPAWSKRYNFAKKNNECQLGKYAADQARFSSHNELFFSVKSIRKYLPWVNKIYVVTDNQKPNWLKQVKNHNVIIIDHQEIIDPIFLPTFNSHVIEANLHNIKDLSEHFIYFNDDVFVARPLPPGHFFKSNGLASIFPSFKSLKKMEARGIITPTLSASLISANLINDKFNFKPDIPLVHTYVPLRKSTFIEAWEIYGDEIKDFLPNKFRTNYDLNLATFLVPWLSYAQAKATFERDICYYFNIRSRSAKSYYVALKKLKDTDKLPHSFCANDFNSENCQNENYAEKLSEALEYQFNFEENNEIQESKKTNS
jgi:hypothetical protein